MNKSNTLTLVLFVIVGLFVAPTLISLVRGPAPTPDVFEARLTLAQAQEQSAQSDKPVMVLVTADWCAPCQALKRGALADEQVAAWIEQNTVPVYLEHGANPDEIGVLPVKSFPTTLFMRDGVVLGGFAGNAGVSEFLSKAREITGAS